jgi:hypothetical protein
MAVMLVVPAAVSLKKPRLDMFTALLHELAAQTVRMFMIQEQKTGNQSMSSTNAQDVIFYCIQIMRNTGPSANISICYK